MFILYVLAVVGGLILLVIPGLLLIVVYQYAVAISVTHDRSAYKSLKESYELGKKHFGFSVVFLLFIIALGGLGALTKVGMLVTVPFTAVCMCVAAGNLKK